MEAKKSSPKKMCPSYLGKTGAQLFGVLGKDGKVNFITPLTVTKEFLELNRDKNNLEQRFRFTGKCAEKGCSQWNNAESKCSLSKKVQDFATNRVEKLSFCPIRSQCRWFFQDGENACYSCNEVTRNMEELLLNI